MKDKIKMILASKGYSSRSLSTVFDCTPQSAATKVLRGIKSIDDLIKLCDYCNAKIEITLENGTIISLNKDDIE